MYRDFALTIKDVEVSARIICDFSNVVRIEFVELSLQMLKSGYKHIALGVAEFPAAYIENSSKAKIEIIKASEHVFATVPSAIAEGEYREEPNDREKQEAFRRLMGKAYFRDEHENSKPVQLTLF